MLQIWVGWVSMLQMERSEYGHIKSGYYRYGHLGSPITCSLISTSNSGAECAHGQNCLRPFRERTGFWMSPEYEAANWGAANTLIDCISIHGHLGAHRLPHSRSWGTSYRKSCRQNHAIYHGKWQGIWAKLLKFDQNFEFDINEWYLIQLANCYTNYFNSIPNW